MNIRNGFAHKSIDWVDVSSEKIEEVSSLHETYGISNEVVAYSLDKNEKAHVEYDELSNTFLLIYNVPYQQKIDNHYETGPMTFLIKDNHLITISNDKTEYIAEKMRRFLDHNPGFSLYRFLFCSLFLISDTFFPLVEEVSEKTKLVNHKLREKTTNKNILELSDLEIGLVYLLMASKQNVVLLEQLKAHSVFRMLTEVEKEQLDDAMIEARQLVEMAQISSQILQQLSGTYNNILNNNLNDIIRTLTVLSILLTIPTIVAGFFGMNMPLPLESNNLGWIFSILISFILCFGLGFIIRKLLHRNNKK